MSQLQKAIGRIQRREGPGIGFAQVTREQPRAMLLALRAKDATGIERAFEQGADAVVVTAADASAGVAALGSPNGRKRCAGVLLTALDEAGAKALAAAGCDFAIAPATTTASEAVEPERMGHVVTVTEDADEATLRALGPLQLDALFIERQPGAMTLGEQLALVRVASLAGTPLIATVGKNASVGELRVLRDSGVAAILPPEGLTAADVETLSAALKAVPAPRKARRESHDIALVPAAAAGHDHDEDDDGDE